MILCVYGFFGAHTFGHTPTERSVRLCICDFFFFFPSSASVNFALTESPYGTGLVFINPAFLKLNDFRTSALSLLHSAVACSTHNIKHGEVTKKKFIKIVTFEPMNLKFLHTKFFVDFHFLLFLTHKHRCK